MKGRSECESKIKLLEAAYEMIAKSGYTAVSVDDICQSCGLKKGSFYYFFKSKAALTVATLDFHWENMRVHYEKILVSPKPPPVRIDDYIAYLISLQVKKMKQYGFPVGCPFTFIGCEFSAHEEAVRQTVRRITDEKCAYLAGAIRDGQRDGSFSVRKPAENLAVELRELVLGAMMCARLYNSLAPLHTTDTAARRLLGAVERQVDIPEPGPII